MNTENTSKDSENMDYMNQPCPQRLLNYAAYTESNGHIFTIRDKVYEDDPSKFILNIFNTFHKYQDKKLFISEKEEIIGYFDRLYEEGHINKRIKDTLTPAYIQILGQGETLHTAYALNNIYHDLKVPVDYDLAQQFVKEYDAKNDNTNLDPDEFILSTGHMPNMRSTPRHDLTLEDKLKNA